MTAGDTEPIALLTSNDSGLAHYCLHLLGALSQSAPVWFVTYANSAIDPLVAAHARDLAPLLDPARPESVFEVVEFLRGQGVRFVNLHIAYRVLRAAPYFISLLAELRAARLCTVGTLHDVLPPTSIHVEREALDGLYSLLDGYLVGNEEQRRQLHAHFALGDRPVAVAQLGPFHLLNEDRFDRASARRFLGLPAAAPLVLFFGHLRPEKGLDCLVRALPLLRARLPEANLVVNSYARYLPEYGPWLAELAVRGPAAGLYVRNEFTPSDRIEPLFKAADVVALPYTNVTQSGVLGLAWAFARPVVVTDLFYGAADIHRTSGRAVPAGDETALAGALAELLGLPEERRAALGAAGLCASLKHCSWEANAAALRRLCVLADRAR